VKTKDSFWAISSSSLTMPQEIKELRIGKWKIYSSSMKMYEENLGVIIDGYAMPRMSKSKEFSNLFDADLVYKAYKKYGINFVKYVKGMFSLVIIDGALINVFCDRSGMGKYFSFCYETDVIYTTNLEVINLNRDLTLSSDNIAIYMLMEHYIDDITMYEHVFHNQPGSVVTFSDTVEKSQYWQQKDLLSLPSKKRTFDEMAYYFRDVIKGYIDCFNPISPTMTLTGGNDSRSILAALLNIGVKPRAFTFGNPKSYDGVIAKQIAQKINIKYNCYFRMNPTSAWYKDKALEIVKMGNSLLNIHRAHRLDAIQQEVENYKDTDMIFCGFMGGDYVKGINYDDYITPKLLRLNEYEKGDLRDKVEQVSKDNFVKKEAYNIESVLRKLQDQKCFSLDKKIDRELSYIYNVVGRLHDYQDTYIFSKHVPVVVNIYMDIDFLEMLFSSQYSMMDKDNSSKNQIKRMNQPALHCNIVNMLSPSLSSIEFAKNYSPKEFLGNKLLYLSKRVYRQYFGKKYPESFPYGAWFLEYIESHMDSIPKKVALLYNTERYKESLLNSSGLYMEKSLHKYSNMMNVVENYEYYKSMKGM